VIAKQNPFSIIYATTQPTGRLLSAGVGCHWNQRQQLIRISFISRAGSTCSLGGGRQNNGTDVSPIPR